jgi:hypothetical protein
MKLNFKKTNGPVDEVIENLIDIEGGIRRPRMVREMNKYILESIY